MEMKQKFNFGDEVMKADQSWGDSSPFIIDCIHMEKHQYGFSGEFRYSSGFYEFGYRGCELTYFKKGYSRGEMIYIPIEKKSGFMERIRSKIAEWRHSFYSWRTK